MTWGSELLEYVDIKWGIQPCRGRLTCSEMAALLFDGLPLCLDCADLLWERIEAVGASPLMRNMLPDLWDTAL